MAVRGEMCHVDFYLNSFVLGTVSLSFKPSTISHIVAVPTDYFHVFLTQMQNHMENQWDLTFYLPK